MRSILFVCTGNIFRSVAAEYALRFHLGPRAVYAVGSAGIAAVPQPFPPLIREALRRKGADPAGHVQRKLTAELVSGVDLVVAMGLDHRDFIRGQFQREVLLFNQVCYEQETPVLDVHEAIPDWEGNLPAAHSYVLSVVDYIWDAIPALLAGLERLRPGPSFPAAASRAK